MKKTKNSLLILAAVVCGIRSVGSGLLAAEHDPRTSIAAIRQRLPKLEIPVIDGEFQLVYEPDPKHPNTWFVNDHCLFRDSQGKIHFFGIENPYPTTTEALKLVRGELKESDRPFIETLRIIKGRHLYTPGSHVRVGHAVADNIFGPWQHCKPALDGRAEGKRYAAPFVVSLNGRFWMSLHSATGLAVSDDLDQWQDHPAETPWNAIGKHHRDPCILRMDDGSFLQYYAAADPKGKGRQSISLAKSDDLRKWERLDPCYVRRIPNAPFSSVLESPFVFRHKDLYYLFVCFAHRRYYETLVVVSDTPYQFLPENTITTLFTHAAELIEIDGQTYISSCGIEDPQMLNRSGLWIAKLRWLVP